MNRSQSYTFVIKNMLLESYVCTANSHTYCIDGPSLCPLALSWTIITLNVLSFYSLTPKVEPLNFTVLVFMSHSGAGKKERCSCFVLFTCNLFKALGDNLCLLDKAWDVPSCQRTSGRRGPCRSEARQDGGIGTIKRHLFTEDTHSSYLPLPSLQSTLFKGENKKGDELKKSGMGHKHTAESKYIQ